MLAIILSAAVFMLYGTIRRRKDAWKYLPVWCYGFFGVIFGILINAYFVGVILFEGKERIIFNTVHIAAMSTRNEINGSFYLGTGNIEGEQYYVYFYDKNGGKALDKIKTSMAIVFEENRIDAVIYEVHTKDKFKKLNDISRWCILKPSNFTYFSCYEIHVPVGTIKQQYDLGLKQ
jgi:hypothetical protein